MSIDQEKFKQMLSWEKGHFLPICPACHKQMLVPDSWRQPGQIIFCPKCGHAGFYDNKLGFIRDFTPIELNDPRNKNAFDLAKEDQEKYCNERWRG